MHFAAIHGPRGGSSACTRGGRGTGSDPREVGQFAPRPAGPVFNVPPEDAPVCKGGRIRGYQAAQRRPLALGGSRGRLRSAGSGAVRATARGSQAAARGILKGAQRSPGGRSPAATVTHVFDIVHFTFFVAVCSALGVISTRAGTNRTPVRAYSRVLRRIVAQLEIVIMSPRATYCFTAPAAALGRWSSSLHGPRVTAISGSPEVIPMY